MNRTSLQALTLALALGATLALTAGCVNRQAQQRSAQTEKMLANPTVAVQAAPAAIETIKDTFEVTGSVTTADDAQVGAKIGGKIVAVYVQDGDQVQAGQTLAQLDDSQQRAQLAQAMSAQMNAQAGLSQALYNQKYGPEKSSAALSQAQAGLAASQANLKKVLAGARPEERKQAQAALAAAKVNLATASKNLDRIKALEAQGALAKNQLDAAQNAYAAAEQQYESAMQAVLINKNGSRPEDIQAARDSVKQAQAQVESARAQKRLDVIYDEQTQAARAQVDSARAQVTQAQIALGDAVVKAPFAGHVAGKPLQVGTVVSPGTSIVHLVGVQGSYFDAQVPENYVTKVKAGTQVQVFIDALGSQPFNGHVTAVNPLGTSVGRLFSARVQIDGNAAGIKPNMFARGEIAMKTSSDAVVVPTTAVVSVAGKPGVYIVQDGKAHFVAVTQGIRSSTKVQVYGVQAGQEVILTGQLNVSDGIPVKVVPAGEMSMTVGA